MSEREWLLKLEKSALKANHVVREPQKSIPEKMAVSFPDLGKCKPKGPSYGVWYGFQTPYGSPPNWPIYGVRIKQMASEDMIATT